MAEDFEDQGPEQLDVQRFVGVVRRRCYQFLIPLVLGWLVVWGASWVIPPRYKSGTLILVQQPTMPQNYVSPNVNDDLQARLESITQQILSRTRLLMIIDRLHLYGGASTSSNPDELVERMRKDIDIELVRDPQRQDISSFRIFYSARDPHVAQQVDGELTELFIGESQRVRQQESEGTTNFIQQQLNDARASLAAQEAKVRQFEAIHEGSLPTQGASNLQILAGLQSQLQNEQDALNTAKQQRVYLQALMEQERATEARNRPSGADASGLSSATDLATIDQQLDKLKAQLAELSSRYTDRYPDVLNVKSQIAEMQTMRANLIAANKQRSKEAKLSGGSTPIDTADLPMTTAMMQLQGQLQANQLDITNRESSVAGLTARINSYQSRLNLEPETEQEFADLTRGYDQSKKNYDDLLSKEDQSEMATSMEQMQQGQRFTMLDPPTLPTKPDFPNRLKFCLIGIAFGIALGLVVAGGSEFLDDRLYTEKEIKALLPIAVISEIPAVVNPLEAQNARKRMMLGWATTALVFVAILAGSVFSYLQN